MIDNTVLAPTPSPYLGGAKPYRVPLAGAPIEYHLESNEGLETTELLQNTLKAIATNIVRDYPKMAREFEAEIADRFNVRSEQVIVTAGADDALDRVCRAVLSPERKFILPVPTFEMLSRYPRALGAEIIEIPWLDANYPIDAVVAAVDDDTALIAVVSPNNPTGAVISRQQLQRLSEAAPHVLILVDLAYGEFAEEDITDLALSLPNTVCVRSMSKAWGLAGLRVGYAIGKADVIEWLRTVGQPYAVSGPSLVTALARIRSDESEMKSFVKRVQSERTEISQLLAGLGVTAWSSQGNFVFAKFTDALWLRDALAGLGIGVRAFPGVKYLESAIRITVPGQKEVCQRLQQALRVVLAPEGLLFDMDGVLADVSQSYRSAIIETARYFGVEISESAVSRAKSEPDSNNDWQVTERLIRMAGGNVSLDEVTAVFENFYQGVGLTPGLCQRETLIPDKSLLTQLAAQFPLGIVTGRPRHDAERFLQSVGIRDLFGALVCMEDAPKKPSPAPVCLALEQLGIERAWLVGDAPDDMQAARNAFVLPIGVVSPSDAGAGEAKVAALTAAGGARVLTKLDQLEDLLR